MKLIQKYEARLIVSGDMLEVYLYDKLQAKKETTDEGEQELNISENEIEEIEDSADCDDKAVGDYKRTRQSAQRSRKNLERLVYANVGQYVEKDKFITLTFRKNVDRDELIKAFKTFIRRMKRKYDNQFEYIAVIERGGRGQKKLHLHCVFFNLPYVKKDELREIWKNGFVQVNAFEDENEIARYVIKYVEKTLTDSDYVGKGKKFYFTSQNLKKPEEVYCTTLEAINILNGYEKVFSDKVPLCDFKYDSPFVGCFRYLKINKPIRRKIKELSDDDIEYYNDQKYAED